MWEEWEKLIEEGYTVPCSLIIMHLLPHMPVYTLTNEEVGRDVRQWKEIVCTCGGSKY